MWRRQCADLNRNCAGEPRQTQRNQTPTQRGERACWLARSFDLPNCTMRASGGNLKASLVCRLLLQLVYTLSCLRRLLLLSLDPLLFCFNDPWVRMALEPCWDGVLLSHGMFYQVRCTVEALGAPRSTAKVVWAMLVLLLTSHRKC